MFKVGDKVRWGRTPEDRKWIGEVRDVVLPSVQWVRDNPTLADAVLYRVVWPEESGLDWDDFGPEELSLVMIPRPIKVRPKGQQWPVFSLEAIDTSFFKWQVTKQCEGEDYHRVKYRAGTYQHALNQLEDSVLMHLGIIDGD